jgi:hypothetical protein
MGSLLGLAPTDYTYQKISAFQKQPTSHLHKLMLNEKALLVALYPVKLEPKLKILPVLASQK